MNSEKILKEIKSIIRIHLPQDSWRIYLFGSQARNTATSASDYDIAIEGPEAIPLNRIAKINTEIEESDIPVHVDVVDMTYVSTRFRDSIIKTRTEL